MSQRWNVAVKKIIKTDKVNTPIGPFSQGVVVGDWVFVSGTGGLDERTGKVVSPNVKDQAVKMMENVQNILKAENLTLNDVVKAAIYLTNMDDYKVVNEVYAKYMGNNRPARTCVEVSRLPAEEKVKIELIAVKPK